MTSECIDPKLQSVALWDGALAARQAFEHVTTLARRIRLGWTVDTIAVLSSASRVAIDDFTWDVPASQSLVRIGAWVLHPLLRTKEAGKTMRRTWRVRGPSVLFRG